MKKFLPLVLITAILFNSGGYFYIFRVLQKCAKEEIEKQLLNGLDENDLTVIIIPLGRENQIHWTKTGKEFIYKGSMFDIVKTKVHDNHKYYYCINDIKEKKLVDQLTKSHSKTKDLVKKLKNVLQKYYFPNCLSILNYNLAQQCMCCVHDNFYKSNISEILTPPPKA